MTRSEFIQNKQADVDYYINKLTDVVNDLMVYAVKHGAGRDVNANYVIADITVKDLNDRMNMFIEAVKRETGIKIKN